MKTVYVNTSKPYYVYIGSGIINTLGEKLTATTKAAKVAIVSDSNVWPIYGESVIKNLANANFDVSAFVFPAGEESKRGEVYLSMLEQLANEQLTRSDCIVALGGGVVGDMAGFAAATFLRGIDYVQIPTTVLSAVDSSVGGKTAIDLKAGKNLVGAFYQPLFVLCDTDMLSSLPRRIFLDGCAEIIKYGVLYDHELFDHLLQYGAEFNLINTICRCIELKRDVVSSDEFDRGQRAFLNLGHTIGHAIEAQSNFGISHGQAVAAGMAIISRTAAKQGFCSAETAKRIENVLAKFDLPTKTDLSAKQLFSAALSDKKRSGNKVPLILPQRIGKCMTHTVTTDQLESFIEAGL